VHSAIVGGGLTDGGLPALAVARAHWTTVHTWVAEGRFWFTARDRPWRWEVRQRVEARNIGVRIPFERERSGKAQVPRVPAEYRPKGALTGYHILFEAVWEPTPPVDPILLKHIAGPFFVALAQWDLSPLERAVLRARL